MSVQSSLVMYPIYAFGSEAQRRSTCPAWRAARSIGCFGLTEADGGSDPASMRTTAKKVDGGYVLNGAKMWITNAPIADVCAGLGQAGRGDPRLPGRSRHRRADDARRS